MEKAEKAKVSEHFRSLFRCCSNDLHVIAVESSLTHWLLLARQRMERRRRKAFGPIFSTVQLLLLISMFRAS